MFGDGVGAECERRHCRFLLLICSSSTFNVSLKLVIDHNWLQVQGEAQGTKDALTSFFGYLQTGPSLAVVEKVEKEDIPVIDGEKGFHVRA